MSFLHGETLKNYVVKHKSSGCNVILIIFVENTIINNLMDNLQNYHV